MIQYDFTRIETVEGNVVSDYEFKSKILPLQRSFHPSFPKMMKEIVIHQPNNPYVFQVHLHFRSQNTDFVAIVLTVIDIL